MKWNHAALLAFVGTSALGWFLDSSALELARYVLFGAFVATTGFMFLRSTRDPVRFTPAWVGHVEQSGPHATE